MALLCEEEGENGDGESERGTWDCGFGVGGRGCSVLLVFLVVWRLAGCTFFDVDGVGGDARV